MEITIIIISILLVGIYLTYDIYTDEKHEKRIKNALKEVQKIQCNIYEKENVAFNTIIQGEKIEIDLSENSIDKLLLTLKELKEKQYQDIFIKTSACLANTIDIYPYKNKTKEELTAEITKYYLNKTIEVISKI